MADIKVGDKVVPLESPGMCPVYKHEASLQDVYARVTKVDSDGDLTYTIHNASTGAKVAQCFYCLKVSNVKLYEGDKEVSKERRTFRLLKETPTLKKGAIFQEQCDDGTQPYSLIEDDHKKANIGEGVIQDRSLVEDQPKWFVEVFKVTPEYMNATELEQWKAFQKSNKPAKKKVAKRASSK